MSRRVPLILLSALFVAPWLVPSNAAAYSLQYAGSEDLIRWKESCFQYSIHKDGLPDIDDAALHDTIRASFDAWENVDCSYFYFIETDDAACDDIGYVEDTGNMNLLVFRTEKWEVDNEHDPSAIALTTTSWDDLSGRMLDADIEFNAEYFNFGIDGSRNLVDLQNTATHEIGHMLGLDHSNKTDATMAPTAGMGDVDKRTLASDDEDGLCALYPDADDPDSCKAPHCGLDLTCTKTVCDKNGIAYYAPQDEGGCSVVGPLGARVPSSMLHLAVEVVFGALY